MNNQSTSKSRFNPKPFHSSKSANTTSITSRPVSYSSKLRIKSLREFLNSSFLNLDFVFYNEIETQSVSLNYCFEKAVYFYTIQKYDFAAKMFQKVIELDKNNFQSINNLSVCMIKANDLNEGINGFHEVMQINKALESSYYNIALAYLLFDKPQEALLCIKSSEGMLTEKSDKFKDLEKFIHAYREEKNHKLISRKTFLKESGITSMIAKKNPVKQEFSKEKLNKTIGFNQSPVNERSSTPIFDDALLDKMKVKMNKLRDKVYKDIKIIIKKEIPKAEKLESKYLTQDELREVKVEFQKTPKERNYEKIDLIFGKLAYFQKYSRDIKRQIYEIGDIVCYLPGEYIFRQGEVGENMYVILKGAITVERERDEYGGKKIAINSLYDGNQFGELALLNALNSKTFNSERTASCIASEKTYLYCMPKLNLSEVILLSNKKDLDDKLEFLFNTSFFRGFDRSLLISLASNIEKLEYRFNEVILAKGDVPKGLYIIKKGHVGLFTEGYTVREQYTNEFSPIRTQKPRPSPMYFSRDPPERLKKVKRETLARTPESVFSKFKTDDKKRLNRGGIVVKDRIAFATLKEYDFFGSRTILKGFSVHEKIAPTKFSIISQSNQVEVVVISSYHMQFLTQEMSLQFLTILEKSYEVDCPEDVDAEKMDDLFHCWQNYKSELLSNIRKDNYISKNKLKFPYNLL